MPIQIDVLSGLLKPGNGSAGVHVDIQGGTSKNTEVNLVDAVVQGSNPTGKSIGIEIYRNKAEGGDVTVALKGDAKIEELIDYGIFIHDDWAKESSVASDITVTTEDGTNIGTDSESVDRDGITVWIRDNRGATAKRDVTVTHKGKIYAKRYGVYIIHRHQHSQTNAGGTATVTIDESGLIKMGADSGFGIRVHTPDKVSNLREHSVTVRGKVLGGKDGGAIELLGGGTINIGPKAVLRPDDAGAAYQTVKIVSPEGGATVKNLVLNLDLNMEGINRANRKYRDIKNINNGANGKGKTDIKYKKTADGSYQALPSAGVKVATEAVTGLPCGFYNDCQGTEDVTLKTTDADDNGVFSLIFESTLSAERTAPEGVRPVSTRGRVVEALPSVLWDLTGNMDTYRLSAMAETSATGSTRVAQTGMMVDSHETTDHHGWGSIEGFNGERKLRKSLASNLSYRLSHGGFAAGVDLAGENGLLYRIGLHRRQGKARVTKGGQVEVAGTGAGFGIGRSLGTDLSVHGWLGATRFDDIEVVSSETVNGQTIKVGEKTKGTGYVLGLGIAKRMTFGAIALTQRGDLMWSSVSMKDFMSSYSFRTAGVTENSKTTDITETVAMKKGSGLTGRYGVMLEGEYEDASGSCCRLFGSLDLEHDFHAKRQTTISGVGFSETAMSEIKPTSMRLGFGGSSSWNRGESAISGAVYHTTSGSGNSILSGGITVSVRF